ncbi:alpha-hydroxy acid oxidase [Arenibacterium halophilum]|uniref:Alpha-hydroxy-acid oxidizing protein n=1 Tax=Arenibacterium halophilum TaxID=2583821 RepID=A0ABY2X0C0_9RHOB|nr:alpha-hydroxy acid oxidase [Arenibacterium halophilum]TMV08369.1 alpha-hydroxy-acid oxidizing protein [Arenibacterium halophilum]
MNVRQAINIEDVRDCARRYLPRIAFDFVDGGVDGEAGLERNRVAFDRWRLLPNYLVDVSCRSQKVTLFGHDYDSPFGISPMGIAGFFRPGADLMLARAAAQMNVPYLMSSASCDSIEDASAVGRKTTWFQIYGTRNPEITMDLIRRAKALEVPVLLLTIDTPVMAKRERNIRNGFTRPMKMTPAVILQGLSRPAWTMRYLRNAGIPMMENWRPYAGEGADANTVADLYGTQTPAPEQTWEVLRRVRAAWDGPLAVKGVLTPEDARRCADLGADGVIVSNHGGRQLDHAPASVDMLPHVVDAVGDRMEVLIDSGIRRGSDIAKALCLGAKATLFGRPAMFGVAAGGQAGAEKVIDIYRQELSLVMGMMGWTSLGDASPERLFDLMNPVAPNTGGPKAARAAE